MAMHLLLRSICKTASLALRKGNPSPLFVSATKVIDFSKNGIDRSIQNPISFIFDSKITWPCICCLDQSARPHHWLSEKVIHPHYLYLPPKLLIFQKMESIDPFKTRSPSFLTAKLHGHASVA